MGDHLSKTLSLVLAVSLMSTATAHAAPVVTKTVELQVDVSDVPESEQGVMEKFIRERVGARLEEAGYHVSSSGASRSVAIRVAPINERFGDYGIYFDLERGGETIEPGLEWAVCAPCTKTEVSKRAEAMTKEAVVLLGQPPTPPAPRVAHDANANSDTGSSEVDDPEPVPKPIGPVGITGAVLGVAGIGLIASGAFFLTRDEEERFDPLQQTGERERLDTRGWALLGSGLAAFTGGVILVAVDVAPRVRTRRFRASAMLGPSWGIQLGGHF